MPQQNNPTTKSMSNDNNEQAVCSSNSSLSSCSSNSSNSSLNSNLMHMIMNNNTPNHQETKPNITHVTLENSGLSQNTALNIQVINNQELNQFTDQHVQYHQLPQQQDLMQPTQECRVEIPSPTNAQMEEINTKDLAHRVSSELKRYSIPQAVFAQRVLCRSQGTLSDLLRNPKPWSKLKSGRETFRRMYKWLQEPESQRMNSLRIAAASKRKEDEEDCLNNSINTEKTNEYPINSIEEENVNSEKDEDDEEDEESESENEENSNTTK